MVDDEVTARDDRYGHEFVKTEVPPATGVEMPNSAERTGKEVEIVISSRLAAVLMSGLVIFGALMAGILLGLYLQDKRTVEQAVAPVLAPQPQLPVVESNRELPASVGNEPGPIRVGELAPDFSLKDLDGNLVRLTDFRGKAVLVNFWATWCPPCRFEMPTLQRVYEKHRLHDFVVLAVDTGERSSGESMRVAARAFASAFNLTFPIVLDEGDQVANLYNLRAYPTSFFVDREGKLTDIRRGAFINEKDIDRYLARLLPEDSIR